MARPTNDERNQKIHYEALMEFDRIQDAMRDERQMCLDDRRFYSIAGAQWEGDLAAQFENKPKFEVNKIHLAVLRIINEYRNNRISVKFVSKDGSKDEKLAEVCAGLFRADEHDSGAEEAYDNAFEEAVGGGFGALRLRAMYENDEDPEDERQRICIEPVFDADSCVFFDLDAKRQDKADAKHAFVIYSMTPEAYMDEWNDDPASWPKEIESSQFDWNTPDAVFVAEYYRVEGESDAMITYIGVAGDEKKILESRMTEEQLEELEATGYTEVKRKKIKAKRVHKYILSGGKVLEDCGLIAGKHIPVVPVYGKRWYIDNVERCMGHVRLCKDAQRLKNMQLSKLGELSALSGVQKPIFTPEQMDGHQVMWAEDNIKNYAYMLVNPITDVSGNPMPAGPIGYTKAPEVPQALAALLQITEQDMQSILGNQQEADKMVSNIAEKTVLAIQSRMDMQTYIYVSNFAKAVRRVGEIWLSMARDVYVEDGRSMKTVGATADEIGTVTLLAPVKDENTGALTEAADLSRASFDVAVEVGPSSSSKREATVQSLTGMLKITQDPETASVLQALAMMNMDGEGIGDVREYFRKRLVKMGVLKPTDEEKAAMEAVAKKPDPQEEALLGMAEEAKAKATQARASVMKTLAEVKLTEAKTVETLANADLGSQERAMKLAQASAPPPPEKMPEVPPMPQVPEITVHIHNDGEQTTRIHKIERGPDGEMIAAEIVKGGKKAAE